MIVKQTQDDIINDFTSRVSLLMQDNISKRLELFEPRVMVPGEIEPPADNKVLSGKRAQGIIRGWTLVLAHHGASSRVLDSFRTQVTAYLDHPSEAVFFKRAKYLTVAPMAQYLRCEKPKVPDLDFKPTGQYRNWAKTRLKVFNRKNTHLWYSFLQAKRAALPLSVDLVLTTYEEHREAMGLEDPIDDEVFDLVMKELEPVLKTVQMGVRRLYDTDDRDNFVTEREANHVASTRACFEKSRAKGGQLGHIASVVPSLERCNPLNPTANREIPTLRRMQFYPWVVVAGRVHHNVVLEEYEYSTGEVQWKDAVLQECVRYVGGATMKCTIQAVLEPLKVRVISKGEAFPYYVSKRLQESIHTVMREMPCFRLIGRPLCPTDLFDLAENRTILGSGRYEWFSIDYSAATDKLSARLSAAILSRITEGQDDALRSIWLSVLAPHMCQYPFPFSKQVRPVQQKNGQLMGSILSFPILCLANLGLYLANIEKDSRPLGDKLRGVLVNGDDMLYVGKHSMWEPHVELGKKVGLTMSPGKAYYHSTYANANSACFHYDLYNKRSTPWAIPFLNSGLYFGQNKVMGTQGDGEDDSKPQNLTSTINRLLDGTLPGKQCDVLKMYLGRHSREINKECQGRNLFVSPSLGGMGVEPPLGWKYDITLAQRVEACRRYKEDPYLHLGFGPMPAPAIEEAPRELTAPWLVPKATREKRYLKGWRGLPDLLSRSIPLCQPVQFCKARRDGKFSTPRSVPQNRFAKEFTRDTWLEIGEQIQEELEYYEEQTMENQDWFHYISM
jgi:hypothetical protein